MASEYRSECLSKLDTLALVHEEERIPRESRPGGEEDKLVPSDKRTKENKESNEEHDCTPEGLTYETPFHTLPFRSVATKGILPGIKFTPIPFQGYRPLVGQNAIRLIGLYSAKSPEEELRCTLRHYDIASEEKVLKSQEEYLDLDISGMEPKTCEEETGPLLRSVIHHDDQYTGDAIPLKSEEEDPDGTFNESVRRRNALLNDDAKVSQPRTVCIPIYHALSYVWGKEDNSHTLWVGDWPIKISTNLDKALRALRRIRPHMKNMEKNVDEDAFYIWVDAICINQADPVEKSQQVRLMFKTYSLAEGVMVYLGESKEGGKVLKFLRDIANTPGLDRWDLATEGPSLDKQTPEENSAQLRQMAIGALGSESLEPLERFFSLPWFTRRWVIQEAATSNGGIALCGDSAIDWHCIDTAAMKLVKLERTGVSIGIDPQILAPIIQIEKIQVQLSYMINTSGPWLTPTTREDDLLKMFIEFEQFECKNDKDRIFALLGIAEACCWAEEYYRPDHWNSLIDYTKTTSEIYRRFTAHYLENNSHMMLNCAGAFRGTEKDDLPSWVPNWKNRTRFRPFRSTHGHEMCQHFRAGEMRPWRTLGLTYPNYRTRLKEVNQAGSMKSESQANGPIYISPDGDSLIASGFRVDKILSVLNRNNDAEMELHVHQVPWFIDACGELIVQALINQQDPWALSARNPLFLELGRCLIAECAFLDIADDAALLQDWEEQGIEGTDIDSLRYIHSFVMDWRQNTPEQDRCPQNQELFFENESWPDGIVAYMKLVRKTLRGRTFFNTEKRYFGLGPCDSKAGDAAVIFHQTLTPFVLRSVGEKRQTWRLVGDAYLSGFMYGEIFGMSEIGAEEFIIL